MNEISYSVKIISQALNITDRRVQQLSKEGIFPQSVKGKYPLIPCVQAYIKYLQESRRVGNVSDVGDDGNTKEYWMHRTRLEKAKADKTEFEVSILKTDFVNKKDTQKVWSDMVMSFRAKMLNLPKRLAGQILTVKTFNEAEEVLKKAVDEALTELSQGADIDVD